MRNNRSMLPKTSYVFYAAWLNMISFFENSLNDYHHQKHKYPLMLSARNYMYFSKVSFTKTLSSQASLPDSIYSLLHSVPTCLLSVTYLSISQNKLIRTRIYVSDDVGMINSLVFVQNNENLGFSFHQKSLLLLESNALMDLNLLLKWRPRPTFKIIFKCLCQLFFTCLISKPYTLLLCGWPV